MNYERTMNGTAAMEAIARAVIETGKATFRYAAGPWSRTSGRSAPARRGTLEARRITGPVAFRRSARRGLLIVAHDDDRDSVRVFRATRVRGVER